MVAGKGRHHKSIARSCQKISGDAGPWKSLCVKAEMRLTIVFNPINHVFLVLERDSSRTAASNT